MQSDQSKKVRTAAKTMAKRLAKIGEDISETTGLLRAFIEHSPSAIFLKDLEGRYLLINRSFESVVGKNRDLIHGKTDYDIFPEKVAAEYRKTDLSAIKARKHVEFEEVAPHQDKTIHSFYSIKFPLIDKAGAVFATGGIVTDITELKKTEQALFERLRFEEMISRKKQVDAENLYLREELKFSYQNIKFVFGFTI
jgi:PAS domain S-box-containing protein